MPTTIENNSATIRVSGYRKLAGDQLLNGLGALRGVGRTKIAAEHAGHVIEKLAVGDRRDQDEWVGNAFGATLGERFLIEPERLSSPNLALSPASSLLVASSRGPRDRRSTVHEKKCTPPR